MPLLKVQSLSYSLINRGYVRRPRTQFCWNEFSERMELLVMSEDGGMRRWRWRYDEKEANRVEVA